MGPSQRRLRGEQEHRNCLTASQPEQPHLALSGQSSLAICGDGIAVISRYLKIVLNKLLSTGLHELTYKGYATRW